MILIFLIYRTRYTGRMRELLSERGPIRSTLEAANSELYEVIRSDIRRGRKPDALLGWIGSSVALEEAIGPGQMAEDREVEGPVRDIGYDYLDELVSGVFQFEEPEGGGSFRERLRWCFISRLLRAISLV